MNPTGALYQIRSMSDRAFWSALRDLRSGAAWWPERREMMEQEALRRNQQDEDYE